MPAALFKFWSITTSWSILWGQITPQSGVNWLFLSKPPLGACDFSQCFINYQPIFVQESIFCFLSRGGRLSNCSLQTWEGVNQICSQSCPPRWSDMERKYKFGGKLFCQTSTTPDHIIAWTSSGHISYNWYSHVAEFDWEMLQLQPRLCTSIV